MTPQGSSGERNENRGLDSGPLDSVHEQGRDERSSCHAELDGWKYDSPAAVASSQLCEVRLRYSDTELRKFWLEFIKKAIRFFVVPIEDKTSGVLCDLIPWQS